MSNIEAIINEHFENRSELSPDTAAKEIKDAVADEKKEKSK